MPKPVRGSVAAFTLSGSKQKIRSAYFNRNGLLTYRDIQQAIVTFSLPRSQYHTIPIRHFTREQSDSFALYMNSMTFQDCASTTPGCICMNVDGQCVVSP